MSISDIDVKIPTVSVRDYLASENGRKALEYLHKEVKIRGKDSCKKGAWKYLLYSELETAFTERLPNSVYFDFDVKASIMDADPADVFYNWVAWTDSEYAGNILGTDDDEYYEEAKSAFGNYILGE